MMGRIVGVSGLCGVGKTTAVSHLARVTGGDVVYFGATVRRVVRERGLPETSASEQIVRIELREQHGPACLAMLEAERMKAILAQGRHVFVDAVYCGEEFDYLSRLAAGFFLIGIEACFGTRLARLGVRVVRPMTEPELRERDTVDLIQLQTGNVLAKASIRIDNEFRRRSLGRRRIVIEHGGEPFLRLLRRSSPCGRRNPRPGRARSCRRRNNGSADG
jgi:dephospho-CoA kinase